MGIAQASLWFFAARDLDAALPFCLSGNAELKYLSGVFEEWESRVFGKAEVDFLAEERRHWIEVNDPRLSAADAKQVVYSAILALWACGADRIKMGPMRAHGGSSQSAELVETSADVVTFELDDEDYQRVGIQELAAAAQLLQAMQDLSWGGSLQIFRAFLWIALQTDMILEAKVLHAWIAVEALYGTERRPSGSYGMLIGDRIARLAFPDKNEADDIRTKTIAFYRDIRNKVAHGAPINAADQVAALKDGLKLSQRILRNSLRRILGDPLTRSAFLGIGRESFLDSLP